MSDEAFYKKIAECEEHELYFIINEIGGFLWRMNHDLADGRIKSSPGIDEDLKNLSALQQKAVEQTVRFGVPFKQEMKMNSILKEEVLVTCDEYWQWYRFWDKWKDDLKPEEWAQVSSRISNEQGIGEFLPKEKWSVNPNEEKLII